MTQDIAAMPIFVKTVTLHTESTSMTSPVAGSTSSTISSPSISAILSTVFMLPQSEKSHPKRGTHPISFKSYSDSIMEASACTEICMSHMR